MKKKLLMGFVGALVAAAASFGAPEAKAQGFGVSVGFGGPSYGYGHHGYAPVTSGHSGYGGGYYAPRRRVVVREPVYYAPRPVVRRVVYQQPVYYTPRRTVRRVVYQQPVYYAPRRTVRRVVYRQPAYYAPRRVVYRQPVYRSNRVVTRRVVTRGPVYTTRRVVRRSYY